MDSPDRVNSHFAPPGRVDSRTIWEQVDWCVEHPVTRIILDMINGFALVLNEQRQILACNEEVLQALELDCPDCIIGLRPGESFNCVHFTEGPDGCGTSPHCRSCGAVIAILASMENNQPITEECSLTMMQEGTLRTREFKVRASPIELGDKRVTVLILQDISDSKRKQVMEQVFFHDILNTIGGIEGWSTFLENTADGPSAREIATLAERLKEEVYAQRTLMEAESGDLELDMQPHGIDDILDEVRVLFTVHQSAHERILDIRPTGISRPLTTDRTLLVRILINMVKNALEATRPGGTVTVTCQQTKADHILFSVHNDWHMSANIQERIFERSFTTKGSGRGIGTWSMKLLGEEYLSGQVSFESDASNGTTFHLKLPVKPSGDRRDGPGSRQRIPTESAPVNIDATHTIMIVDDNEPVLRLTELFVSQTGAMTATFRDPLTALQELEREPQRYHAALIDIGLPVMSGLELARRLRKTRPDLPIAVMTGYSEMSVQKGLADIDQHLLKPFSRDALVQVLEALLEPVNNVS